MDTIDTWRLLAGIAFFLLGMSMLEKAIKELSGRSFKLFLKRQGSRQFTAVGSGALATCILQSSSVVNLMVLAFVGAGVMTMQYALAVTLGANLGTTLSTWVVATVGFKIDIEYYALPIVGIAGIGVALLQNNTKWYRWCMLLFGMGLLFFGLAQMRESIESLVTRFDFSLLANYPVIVFVIAGIIITSLIQSSSATIAIVLSALHANVFPLYTATAIVLGSEIGTTLKLLIASAGSLPAKKRVALGNFLFNIIAVVLVLIFLGPVNHLITEVIGIKDNLIALSFFQTLINIVSIIVFYPFLHLFGSFLERQFKNSKKETLYIHKVPPAEVETAVEALEKETGRFLQYVIHYCLGVLGADKKSVNTDEAFTEKDIAGQYQYIKRVHGDIYAYYLAVQQKVSDENTVILLDSLARVARNGMYTAKSMKDASYDAEQLRNSSTQAKYDFYIQAGKIASRFFDKIYHLLGEEVLQDGAELVRLYNEVQEAYKQTLHNLYKEQALKTLIETDVSTVINFNHEVYASLKAMIFAIKDFRLSPADAVYFEDIPGFIR